MTSATSVDDLSAAPIGVLALQGGFAPHLAMLRAIGRRAHEVRRPVDLDGCGGLVLPGGESTAQLKLLDPGLREALERLVRTGAPVLATCAGLVLIAREVLDPDQPSLGWLEVTVRRNAYGAQVHSRETQADDGSSIVLIRAPKIARVGDVEVEATLRGEPILVRRDRIWGATYHPELTDDPSLHRRIFGTNAPL